MSDKLLPCAIIAISVGAAIVYGFHGDWRHTLYWIAGAAITVAVTF